MSNETPQNNEPRIIDEANYAIKLPRPAGPAAVGRGGDPLFRRINASKEQLEELLDETTTVQDWVQRETCNNVALACLNNENLKEIYNLNNLKENFKKGEKIFLPQPIAEEMLIATKNQLIGLDKMPKDPVQLSEEQIVLRDKIQGKKFFITDKDISAKEIATAISDTYKPIYITVLRNNEEVKLNPIIADKNGIMGVENKIEELYTPTTNFKSGIVNSYIYLKTNTQYMLMGLGSIFTGKVPLKDMHGIVAITKIGGNVIEHQGIYKGLLLTAIIISMLIFNNKTMNVNLFKNLFEYFLL